MLDFKNKLFVFIEEKTTLRIIFLKLIYFPEGWTQGLLLRTMKLAKKIILGQS